MADRSDIGADRRLREQREGGGMMTDAVRREAENELARLTRAKAEGLKDYEKTQRAQAEKTARLRALRLAREAQQSARGPKRAPPARTRGH